VDELLELLKGCGGAAAEGCDEVAAIWASDIGPRPFIEGFLKDKALGDKRFMSMPDRFTNTVNTVDPADPSGATPGPTVCRPSVVNNFVGDLASFEAWWGSWKAFMFGEPLSVKGRKGGVERKAPVAMLSKIPRAKYPALSEAEERYSLPMQV